MSKMYFVSEEKVNSLIHEHFVLGCRHFRMNKEPNYYRNLVDAWEVIMWMNEEGYVCHIDTADGMCTIYFENDKGESRKNTCENTDSMAIAINICFAALDAKEAMGSIINKRTRGLKPKE